MLPKEENGCTAPVLPWGIFQKWERALDRYGIYPNCKQHLADLGGQEVKVMGYGLGEGPPLVMPTEYCSATNLDGY